MLLKEEMLGKDEMVETLNKTIMKKGKQNQRLSELVNTFKQELINDQVFQQTFGVMYTSHLGRFEYTVSDFKF